MSLAERVAAAEASLAELVAEHGALHDKKADAVRTGNSNAWRDGFIRGGELPVRIAAARTSVLEGSPCTGAGNA
jgi:hypothetical protein